MGGYLEELLDSLLNQTYKDIVITIRDDGSTDNTLEIINRYIESNKNIHLLKDSLGNVGSTKSFLLLLSQSKADYMAFCDQDDVWCKTKIEKCLNSIKEIEDPALSFCDLEVVDKDLNTIYGSYYEYRNIDISNICLSEILNKGGIIPGCTMLINKKLKDMVRYSDINSITVHDLYVSYIAACLGNIQYANEPLIKYRQTGNNQIGVGKPIGNSLFKKIRNVFKYGVEKDIKVIQSQLKNYEMIKEFRNNYLEHLNPNETKQIGKILKKEKFYKLLLRLFCIIKKN